MEALKKETENSKLIADFMEIKPIKIGNRYSYNDGVFFCSNSEDKEKVEKSIYEYVKYHKSWDWLMPVVEKIESIIPEGQYILIEYKSCIIPVIGNSLEDSFDIVIYGDSKIDSVYKAVIEFIKWYNDKPQEP